MNKPEKGLSGTLFSAKPVCMKSYYPAPLGISRDEKKHAIKVIRMWTHYE